MSLYEVKILLKNIGKKSLPKRFLFIARFKLRNILPGKEMPRCTRQASFTVEAAVILPLLAGFFVSILFFFRVMQVQMEVQKALEYTARELAVCLEEESVYDGILAKTLFVKNMGGWDEALHYIEGGCVGISLAKSDFGGDEVCLRAEYRLRLPVSFFRKKTLVIAQSAVTRKWVGWKEDGESSEEDTWVYIAETGTVYHRNRFCTHLNLSVRMVSGDDVGSLRNENGGIYRRCYKCADGAVVGEMVYITDEGDCYHTDTDCSGLKRTVRRVRLSEVAGRRCCDRCESKEKVVDEKRMEKNQ